LIFYLDDEYRVHTDPGEMRVPWEDADGIFEGKCKTYVEGYRVIPEGESWKRSDGVVFNGMMVSPVADIRVLEAAQAEYEEAQAEAKDMKAALELLGVTANG